MQLSKQVGLFIFEMVLAQEATLRKAVFWKQSTLAIIGLIIEKQHQVECRLSGQLPTYDT